MSNQYAERDALELDVAGEYYCRHVVAMTREQLHGKGDIAAELGWRDQQIDRLAADNKRLREALHAIYDTDPQVPHPATEAELSMGWKMCIYRARKLVKAALSSAKEVG